MNINDELISRIIEKKDIFTYFQPIYSFNTKKIIGLEALSRGKVKDEQISPYFLFEYARLHGETLKLDRICREKAMEAFPKQNDTSTLFLNFDTSVLNDNVLENGEILKTAEENGIAPENIVIELNEANVRDAYDLLMFIDYYRSCGFLIALDNVGCGIDSQNRIMLINPDIIKIDRAIVSNISSNSYNQEAFKSIIQTAKQLGAMTVAEGVETADDVIACMLMGVDYFQGFYFSKPESFDYIFSNEARLRLEDAAQHLNLSMKNNPTVANVKLETYKRIIYDLVNRLTGISPERYTNELRAYVAEHSEIECAFLIDSKGFQLTPTVLAEGTDVIPGYNPDVIGANHDIKNYFYAVSEQIEDPFISGWYVSAATGQSCKTISSHFFNSDNEMIIVCVDLKRKIS